MSAKLPEFRYWIFDMDGTLTLAIHNFDAIRQQLGIEAGVPILEAIAKMDSTSAEHAHQTLHALEMDIAKQAAPQPGVADFLLQLQQRGCKLGILTRNAEDIAIETLKAAGLDSFFPRASVLGRETCTAKPDPQGILHHMQSWQASAAATVMVGDYHFDLDAGRRAGVYTIHFDTEATYPWPQLTDYGISNFAELQSML